jgi:hypothetical protein
MNSSVFDIFIFGIVIVIMFWGGWNIGKKYPLHERSQEIKFEESKSEFDFTNMTTEQVVEIWTNTIGGSDIDKASYAELKKRMYFEKDKKERERKAYELYAKYKK